MVVPSKKNIFKTCAAQRSAVYWTRQSSGQGKLEDGEDDTDSAGKSSPRDILGEVEAREPTCRHFHWTIGDSRPSPSPSPSSVLSIVISRSLINAAIMRDG